MGATEEQMQMLSDSHVTHVSYVLILYSIAFLLYLFVNILLNVYASHTWPDDESNGTRSTTFGHGRNSSIGRPGHSRKTSTMNGSIGVPTNGSVRLPRHRATDSQQVRDAEEFELEGLISEEESGNSPKVAKKEETV
jgi:hypothetical protein